MSADDFPDNLSYLDWPVAVPDVTDYTAMSDLDLLNELADVREALYDRNEMLSPRTQEGRELHSRRTALLLALRARHG